MSNVLNFPKFFSGVIGDSFRNFLNSFGTQKDPLQWQHWSLHRVLDQAQLEAAFRTDWIARKICQRPAFDMSRAWRHWEAAPEQIEKIEEHEKLHGLQRKMMKAIEKSRLYGGAALIMGVNDGPFNQPLDLDNVGPGDLKFVHVVERWRLAAGARVREITSPWFGEPAYYERMNMPTPDPPGGVPNPGLPTMGYSAGEPLWIHPSRVIQFIGLEYPDMENAMDSWGDSVLQPVAEALRATGLVTTAIAALVNSANLDVISVPGLTSKLQTTDGTNSLISRFTQANTAKSVLNALLLDDNEKWERHQLTMAGYSDVFETYLRVCAGAADFPYTILTGSSPGGLNATGASDIRNYYDMCSAKQAMDLTPAMHRLDEVLIRSALGKRDPSIHFIWNPLWQATDAEKADMYYKKAQTFQVDVTAALMQPEALAQCRINQLIEDGVYPGIEDAIDEFGDFADDINDPDPNVALTQAKTQAALKPPAAKQLVVK